MREGSRFVSFALIVLFAAVVREAAAEQMTGRKPAATVSNPNATSCGGAGQVTVPEAGSTSAQLPEPVASLVIRIRMRENGRILVPVAVNGSGTYAFLFDTGAAITVLSHSLAKRLGLTATREEQVHTFAGKVSLSAGRVDSLRIGNHLIVGSNVLIGDLGHLFNQSPEVDGILGQDILSRFNYLIDRRAASLEIEEGDNLVVTLAGTKVSFERRAGVICVPVAGGALRMLLDSGNPYLVVYEDAARSCNAILAVSGDEGIVGSSLGRRVIRPTRIPSLEIGDIVLRNVSAYLATRGSGRSEDGFLPFHIFNSMYVNNLGNFLIANPRRSQQHRDNRREHETGESRSGEDFGDQHVCRLDAEGIAIEAVTVAEQVAGRGVPRKRLHQLHRGPLCSRKNRNPFRCQLMKVSGLTSMMARRRSGQRWDRATSRSRSVGRSTTCLGFDRWRTAS